MRKPLFFLLSLLSFAAPLALASQANGQVSFPAQLQGTWNPAPYDCGSAPEAANDMRFAVSDRNRVNYEDIETLVSIVEIPGSPTAWRLTTTSNVVGTAEGQSRVYVLGQKYLFVSDGDRMDQYLQCR